MQPYPKIEIWSVWLAFVSGVVTGGATLALRLIGLGDPVTDGVLLALAQIVGPGIFTGIMAALRNYLVFGKVA
ncbi:MAG: hypothetical protein AAGJ87_16830 [Pseudomonadota bacterium]